MARVSVLIPAYQAQPYLSAAVHSLLVQRYTDWEALIIADDGEDYGALLHAQGIGDRRLKFLHTAPDHSGPAHARNDGLDAATGQYIALLDADDQFHPDKLETCLPFLEHYPLVSCALELCDNMGAPLRTVGAGTAQEGFALPSRQYKQWNFSADNMLILDRETLDLRYDESFACLEDLEFVLRCFERCSTVWHVPAPLHRYCKHAESLSHCPEAHTLFRAAKAELLGRLDRGAYQFADPATAGEMIRFLERSLLAESELESERQRTPDLMFEEVMERATLC